MSKSFFQFFRWTQLILLGHNLTCKRVYPMRGPALFSGTFLPGACSRFIGLALVLLLVGVGGVVAPATASADVLVSNLGQSSTSNGSGIRHFDLAQGFTTGSSPNGYVLTNIVVGFYSKPTSNATLTATLATGLPSSTTTVVTLTSPDSWQDGNNTFTAPSGTTLSADTTYYIVVEGNAGELGSTESDEEDDSGMSGWSLGDKGFYRTASSTGEWTSQASASRRVQVNGNIVPDIRQVAVTSTPTSGSGTPKKYGEGEDIQVTVTFIKAVTVTGDPVFEIKMGNSGETAATKNAAYVGGSGTSELVFEYTVVAVDRDNDGILIEANALTLDEDDAIQDSDNNNMLLGYNAPGGQSDHQVDGRLTPPQPPDTMTPVITSSGPFTARENQVSVTTLTASVNGAPVTTGLTWTVTGGADQGHFSLTNGGVLSFNSPQNFESPNDADPDGTYGLTVQVIKDGHTSLAQDIEVQLEDVHEAPVISTPGPFEVNENETAVTTLQATDEDAGSTFTWSITGGADQNHFSLIGSTGELSFKNAKDYEAPADDDGGDQVYNLSIQVRDNHGETAVADLVVALQDVNEGPVNPDLPTINPPRTFAVNENQVAVGTLQATYSGSGMSWSIVSGEDESHFDLDSQTGQLTFDEGKDYDKPEDGGQDNLYHVEVQVTGADDPAHVAMSRILVHLQNVNEAPMIHTKGSLNVEEGERAVATLDATDEDEGSTLIWSMRGGVDAAHFLLTKEGELTFNEAKRLDAPGDADGDGVFEISVGVDDGVHFVTADLEIHP